MILFHHRAALAIANHKSEIENGNWLPGLDSHQHTRLQRALSYELDDPAIAEKEDRGWRIVGLN